jgi:hypothetical protein
MKTWKKPELIRRSILQAHRFGRVMNKPLKMPVQKPQQ